MIKNSNTLSNLYCRIVDENIKLISASTGDNKAVTIKDEIKNVYGIFFNYDNFSNTDEEFCVLSHEYGHCKSGATHKLYSPYQLIGQHENRANRAAVYEFLPLDTIVSAFENGYTEFWQLSEHLDVPESFVRMAVDIYRREGKL